MGGQRLVAIGQSLKTENVHIGDMLGELLPSASAPPPPPPPDYDERSHLHDSFTQMTLSLQEIAIAQGEWGGGGSSGEMWAWSPQEMGACAGGRGCPWEVAVV